MPGNSKLLLHLQFIRTSIRRSQAFLMHSTTDIPRKSYATADSFFTSNIIHTTNYKFRKIYFEVTAVSSCYTRLRIDVMWHHFIVVLHWRINVLASPISIVVWSSYTSIVVHFSSGVSLRCGDPIVKVLVLEPMCV